MSDQGRLSVAHRRDTDDPGAWHAVLEALPDAATLIRPDGTIAYASSTTHRRHGWPAGALQGRPVDDLIVREHRSLFRAMLTKTFDRGGVCLVVHGMRGPTRRTVVETRLRPVHTDATRVHALALSRPVDELAGPAARADPSGSGSPLSRLSPREREVLGLLAAGFDAQAISDALGLSIHTTRGYVKSLLRKLDVRTQLQAVVIATRDGLLTGPSGPALQGRPARPNLGNGRRP